MAGRKYGGLHAQVTSLFGLRHVLHVCDVAAAVLALLKQRKAVPCKNARPQPSQCDGGVWCCACVGSNPYCNDEDRTVLLHDTETAYAVPCMSTLLPGE